MTTHDYSDHSGRITFYIERHPKPSRYFKHTFETIEKADIFYMWLEGIDPSIRNSIFLAMQSDADTTERRASFMTQIDNLKETLASRGESTAVAFNWRIDTLIHYLDILRENKGNFYGKFESIPAIPARTRLLTRNIFQLETGVVGS